ncbi:hypothetical protein [Phaeodactylibacter luteus]|uniref:Uncharacterized protein n=1 Tax=Phaeodactylibacter luteus TaxID=1564516 RepID=A0A5C6RHX4_9BACT|nr:hypothetical protein [Phaeodactylibacter luteus]TXB62006.1 hypothetical protein FRY97_16100 [Phaeodactylibacter luteus]
MKRSIFPILAAAAVFAVAPLPSCQSGSPKDIRDYYLPLKQLEDGLVYEYRPVAIDSLTPIYWFYRSYLREDGIYLTGTYYEHDLIPRQIVREELVSNGMLVEDVFLYEARADSSGLQDRTEVDVLQGAAFPFEVTDSNGVFLYQLQWSPPQDSGAVITLTKNRRYLKDTVVAVLGENLDAVVFSVQELLEYDQNGVFEQQYAGREVYAKGLGLVYYDKQIGPGMELSYALHRRYPMEVLEEQFEQKINHEH